MQPWQGKFIVDYATLAGDIQVVYSLLSNRGGREYASL